ncbi:MAG TPA: hypothetical protein VGO58_18495 [Chitinophagaceae bacterium]|jgi:Tol biopolymer transport system component|nr:hypothetical protein [Chitinophagaceae bacterium]
MRHTKKLVFSFSFTFLACCTLVTIYSSCGNHLSKNRTAVDIPYPLANPDSTPLRFLPATVSSDSLDFGSTFSPDGTSFYFARSENKKLRIYVTAHDGKNWTIPRLAPFTETLYSQADPAFSPDGKLYFISNRPKDTADTQPDYDIWFISALPGGQWSAPENLEPVNSDSNEFYISFSKNGTLYFSSSRAGGFGEEDIYISKFNKEKFDAPVNAGATINTKRSEYDPGISASGSVIVFASSNRDDGFGGADLYISQRAKDDTWKPAVNLGNRFNTKTREYCPYFSPDSKFFFFSSEGDIKWVDARILEKQAGKL